MEGNDLQRSDYAKISSLEELEAAVDALKKRVAIQEDILKSDMDSLFTPINSIKMILSSGAMFLLGGGLLKTVAKGVKAGRNMVELIRGLAGQTIDIAEGESAACVEPQSGVKNGEEAQ